jgi:hypothetical protein
MVLVHADVPLAGKMPALRMVLVHADIPRAGKMPALQENGSLKKRGRENPASSVTKFVYLTR